MNTGLKDKRILVTAGAAGIGNHIAHAFHAEGARVHVCDVDSKALQALSHDEPGITGTLCDVSDREAVAAMMNAAIAQLGGLDVLVNNAGISGATARVEDVDPLAWEEVLQVNLVGMFNVTRLAIPYLKQSGSGAIINMSSVAGRLGYPMRSAYATSKWGVIGFTKSISIELGGFGIRANAILPGAVDGPRFQKVLQGRAQIGGRSLEEVTAEAMASMSVKKLISPEKVAALAVFLASDNAESISGQALSIDGDTQSIA